MANLAVRYDLAITLNEKESVFANPATPATIALTTLADYSTQIAASQIATLFNPTDANGPALPVDFNFLFILSDVDIDVEFTCNEGDANERVFSLRVAANIPFILGSNVGYFNFTAGPAGNAYGGTLDVIDKIRAKNTSATATATVRVALGT